MKHFIPSKTHALGCVAALVLSACGGGGGGVGVSVVDTVVDIVVPAKTITGVIADGLIQGAVMCYDVNDNNKCDVDEPKSSPSAADGSFSISIPASAAGKHAMIADIPATAIDSDKPGVPIGVPLTMMAPLEADTSKPLFVSPLTTAVQEVMNATGNTDKEAAKTAAITQVTQTLGLTVSPMTNYITPPAGTDPAAATQAHNNAQVITEVKKEITTTAIAAGVPAADIPALTSQAVVTNLPAVATAVTNEGTQTPAQAATTVVTATGITPSTVATQSTIANGVATGTTVTAASNTPYVNLRYFTYTDANNWSYRLFTGDGVADSDGFKYSNEVRVIKKAGANQTYNRNTSYYDPVNSKWYECPSDGYKAIKFTDVTATAPGTSLYCHSSAASTRRTVEDLGGKTIASIVDKVRSAGFPDSATWAAPSSVLASQAAVFPADSKLSYVITTDTDIPDQHSLSDKARIYPDYGLPSSAVYEDWPFADSIDTLVERFFGDLMTATNTVGGGNSEGIGSYPDLAVTDATLQKVVNYRTAFKRTDATSGIVRYYKCRRSASTGFTTACVKENDSTYTIETKGDSRVMRLAGMPPALVVLRNNKRIYVERHGAVFYGWTPIATTTTSARLNKEALDALRAKFAGVIAHTDPVAPVAADASSWLRDLRDLADGFSYRLFNLFVTSPAGAVQAGYGDEIRVKYTCLPNGNCPDSLPAPDTFTRNAQFLVNGVWKDGDADSTCKSDGKNLFTWTASPRESVSCGDSVDASASVDQDISGLSYQRVFKEGRSYSGKGYGAHFDNWAGNPNDAGNATTFFPAGSVLRFQTNTIKQSVYTFGYSAGNVVKNYTTTNNVTTNVDAANIAQVIAHHNGTHSSSTSSANGANTLQLYAVQDPGTPPTGTTGLIRYRVSFAPSSATAGTVTFFECKTQVTTNFSINCVQQANSTIPYAVQTMGGKSVLTFAYNANQLQGLKDETLSERTFVEHNGKVYYGGKDFVGSKHNTLRLNKTAYEHMLFTTWGLPRVTVTPIVP